MFNFEYATALNEMVIENTLRTVQAFALAGEQNEKMARLFLDQSKTVREEGVKVAQRWIESARENQRQFGSIVDSAAKASAETYKKQFEAFLPKASKN
jgi:hypothetical protein